MTISPRAALPAAALSLALALSACGSETPATYTAPGHPPDGNGPPITTQTAQTAIEGQGADITYMRGAEEGGELTPRPVDSAHYGTQDAGFFDLYIFVDEAAARAALPSARKLDTVDPGGRVVQVLNVLVVQPENGSRPMSAAVGSGLRQLAKSAATHPATPPQTSLEDHEGGESDQPSGPPA